MSAQRRGGIPGPESRTGLVRPAMTEAEFERRQGGADPAAAALADPPPPADPEPAAPRAPASARSRAPRARPPVRPRRVQRMFAIEEELDKKLWLYAIHLGKDRSEVINDLLRPVVASMVLYDSRDRRSSSRPAAEAVVGAEGQGGPDDEPIG